MIQSVENARCCNIVAAIVMRSAVARGSVQEDEVTAEFWNEELSPRLERIFLASTEEELANAVEPFIRWCASKLGIEYV